MEETLKKIVDSMIKKYPQKEGVYEKAFQKGFEILDKKKDIPNYDPTKDYVLLWNIKTTIQREVYPKPTVTKEWIELINQYQKLKRTKTKEEIKRELQIDEKTIQKIESILKEK